MVKFLKYTDIENIENSKLLESVKMHGLSDPKYIYGCYRKIDGSNFQIAIGADGEIRLGKRSSFTDDSFCNCDEVVGRYGLMEKIKLIRNEIVQNSFGDAKLRQWSDDHPGFSLTLFGELFGGIYRCKNVPGNPKAHRIIGRISYSPNDEFMMFDAAVHDDEDKYVINLDTLKRICELYGLPCQIEEFRGTLKECLEFRIDNIHDDTGVRFFGLPAIEDASLIEGVVIKPIEYQRLGEHRVIFKHKNSEFAEQCRIRIDDKSMPTLRNELEERMFKSLAEYMNANRVLTAISKVGTGKFGEVIKEANTDAIREFEHDHEDELEKCKAMDKSEFDYSHVTKAFNRYALPIVKMTFAESSSK